MDNFIRIDDYSAGYISFHIANRIEKHGFLSILRSAGFPTNEIDVDHRIGWRSIPMNYGIDFEKEIVTKESYPNLLEGLCAEKDDNTFILLHLQYVPKYENDLILFVEGINLSIESFFGLTRKYSGLIGFRLSDIPAECTSYLRSDEIKTRKSYLEAFAKQLTN